MRQSDFSKGMICGVRGLVPFERNEWTSVFWLENMNPNIIIGELHTRLRLRHENILPPTTIAGNLVSAVEMTHSASPTRLARHLLSDASPTVLTTTLDYTAFTSGVWSDNSVFTFPPSDYDLYGEALLLVSNRGSLTSNKRKPVYAYMYKDYSRWYNHKNEAGKTYFAYSTQDLRTSTMQKSSETTPLKRWEVLDTDRLAEMIQIDFGFEGYEANEVGPQGFDYITPDAPDVEGSMLFNQMSYGEEVLEIISEVQFSYTYQPKPVDLYTQSYKLKVGSDTITVKGLGFKKRAGEGTWSGEWMNKNAALYGLGLEVKVSETANTHIKTLPYFPVIFGVQDYMKRGKPRPFYPGETIPYLVTAVINGVEQILKKDVVTVFGTATPEQTTDPFSTFVGMKYSTSANLTSVAYQGIPSRAYFGCTINGSPYSLPIGLTEIRLYIANKNVNGEGLFTVVRDKTSPSEEVEKEEFNQWQEVPENLYSIPDSLREQFAYGLAKSFVLYGDPDLYKRKNIETTHANWGINNVAVNEWEEVNSVLRAKNTGSDGKVLSEFYVWDYMNRTAEPLATNIGSAMTLWKGKGAGCIASMKGVSFIAGCLDSEGTLEPGLIRKSLLQGAVQSTDLFAEQDFIKVGNETHTALIEFRGQLWAFSRSQTHRIQMRDMSDLDTTEVLEVLEGNGTYSPKTVTATPFGVVWANEAGIWLSSGGEPQLLSKEIEPLYHAIIRNTPFTLPSTVRHTFSTGEWNTTFQLVYAPERYELVCSTYAERNSYRDESAVRLDFRCIYNFPFKNWRVETFRLGGEYDTSFSTTHRSHCARSAYYAVGLQGQTARFFELTDVLQKDRENGVNGQHVRGNILLHEIGDGVQDMQAQRVTVDAAVTAGLPSDQPKPECYLYTVNRTRQFVGAGAQGIVDPDRKDEVVSYHLKSLTEPHWTGHRIDTPKQDPSDGELAAMDTVKWYGVMTSQLYRIPFMRPVRSFWVEYVLPVRGRVRTIEVFVRQFARRFFS